MQVSNDVAGASRSVATVRQAGAPAAAGAVVPAGASAAQTQVALFPLRYNGSSSTAYYYFRSNRILVVVISNVCVTI